MVQRAKNVPRLMANDGEELLIAGSVIQHNEGIALPYAFRQSKETPVCIEGICLADMDNRGCLAA